MSLQANTCVFKTARVRLVKEKKVKSINVYTLFTNWIIGEFDLYLKEEAEFLTVYFPNGCFNIINNTDKNSIIKIEVIGKSTRSCKKVMEQLQALYSRMIQTLEK